MISERLLFIGTLTRLLAGRRHVFIGGASPAPATAALLARALSGETLEITALGDKRYLFLSNDYSEIFNCAANGRYDAFFMGGGQIDGQANINLIGIGKHPTLEVRWPGSRGTPMLYMMIPNTVLFVEEHTRRVLVPRVDYISACGTSDARVHRPGGPIALVTPRCVFSFSRERGRFKLESVNPGHSAAEVSEHTGFDYDVATQLQQTPAPSRSMFEMLNARVLNEVSVIYPQFTRSLQEDVRVEFAAAVAN